MVKYVGIPNAEEAKQIHEDFLKRSKAHNKNLRRWCNVIAFLILIDILLISMIPCLMFSSSWKIIAVAMGCASFFAELWIFSLCEKRMKGSEDGQKPIAYQFFKVTEGRQLLNTDICHNENKEKRDLCLTLKDKHGHVSTEYIRNFKLVYHPDATDVVVDLNGGVIYQPCSN